MNLYKKKARPRLCPPWYRCSIANRCLIHHVATWGRPKRWEYSQVSTKTSDLLLVSTPAEVVTLTLTSQYIPLSTLLVAASFEYDYITSCVRSQISKPSPGVLPREMLYDEARNKNALIPIVYDVARIELTVSVLFFEYYIQVLKSKYSFHGTPP